MLKQNEKSPWYGETLRERGERGGGMGNTNITLTWRKKSESSVNLQITNEKSVFFLG